MKKMKFLAPILCIGLMVFTGCGPESKQTTMDVQGHRGYRGLYPENTINGFLKALDAGVNTLEMDVVISNDIRVVVSHEPYFSHEIATGPDGEEITQKTELTYNIYRMNYNDIKMFDVGLKPHPRFPDQKKAAAIKPLLVDVIEAVEAYVEEHELESPNYNIELKRQADYDHTYHPNANIFSKLVLQVLSVMNIEDRTTLQAFDISTLQKLRELNPEVPLALLVENDMSITENINALGFKPDVYSPNFKLIDTETVTYCKLEEIKIIAWTVNKEADIRHMIDLGVDGIISDYPDRVIDILTE